MNRWRDQGPKITQGCLALRKGEGEGCSQRVVLPGGLEPLTLILSPWPRRRGEINGMGLTTGEHYRSHHIVLKSYRQRLRGNNRLLLVHTRMKLIHASLLPCTIIIAVFFRRH